MSMTWIGKARLKLAVIVIGAPLAAFGAISVGPAWLTLPVIGATFYVLAIGVNKTSNRVASSKCWTCGHDLSALSVDGEHGVPCPSCGTLNQHLAYTVTGTPADERDDSASA